MDLKNTIWQVGDDTSKFWSAEAGAYITELPAGYYVGGESAPREPDVTATVGEGEEAQPLVVARGDILPDVRIVTRIPDQEELDVILRAKGLTPCIVSAADYAAAVQAVIDRVAKEAGYNGPATLAGYSTSTVEAWRNQALVFVAWRDAVWLSVYAQQSAVAQGSEPAPTISQIVAGLPVIEWPTNQGEN